MEKLDSAKEHIFSQCAPIPATAYTRLSGSATAKSAFRHLPGGPFGTFPPTPLSIGRGAGVRVLPNEWLGVRACYCNLVAV
jgi:hypothetical protein